MSPFLLADGEDHVHMQSYLVLLDDWFIGVTVTHITLCIVADIIIASLSWVLPPATEKK